MISKPVETILKERNIVENRDKTYHELLIIGPIILLIGSFLFFSRKKRKTELLPRPQSSILPTKSPNENNLNDLIELAKNNSPILYTKFNELDPQFCKRLLEIAPRLLISEQEICIYIRLNFDTKEIARYTRFSVKGIQAKKHRIRKKLNIPTKEDMTNWIINF